MEKDETTKPETFCKTYFKMKYVERITVFSLTCITIYWVYQVIVTYASNPVSSTISMIHNDTFTWPTFTFCPRINCFNRTAVNQLSKEYNLRLGSMGFWDFQPFDMENSAFDWNKYNYSEILEKAKFKRREDVLSDCKYLNTKYYNVSGRDCMREFSKLGTWKSYITQNSPCHSFTPTEATNVGNFIRFYLNPGTCERVNVFVHMRGERSYMEATPIINTYSRTTKNNPQILIVKVKEFKRVSKKYDPCENDPNYSESQCYRRAFVRFLVEESGCYVPELTGYQPIDDYPVCNDDAMFERYSYWRHKLADPLHYEVPPKLQNQRNKCLPRCHRLLYDIEWKNGRQTLGKHNASNIIVYISGDGMMYMKVNEYFSLTVDMLISDIGGTMGLFLGVSGLSFLSFFAFIYERIMKLMTTAEELEMQHKSSTAQERKPDKKY